MLAREGWATVSRWWILVHGDADGVVTGALALAGLGGEEKNVYFTHPAGLLEDLSVVREGDNVFIGDVAITKAHASRILEVLEKLSRHGQVIFIDHHPLPPGVSKSSFPGLLVHDTCCCSSELARKFFGNKLSAEYDRLAIIGAVCDYLDETPWVKQRLLDWDKRLVYFEAGVLSLGLEGSRGLHDFKRMVVKHLSEGGLPSGLSGLVVRALIMAGLEEEHRQYVVREARALKNVAYVIDPKGSIGRAAIYAMSARRKPVGLAIEKKKGLAVISARTRDERLDLNKLLSEIAEEHGGIGGGHIMAAGARVPWERLESFLERLDEKVTRILGGEE